MPMRRRAYLKTQAALLAVAAWPALAADPAAGGDLPQPGRRLRLPQRIELIDGSVLDTAGLQGKVVVLQYWATWCPFCAREMPQLQQLWQAHRAEGLVVLGLSIDQNRADIAPVLHKRGIDYPVAWLDPQLARQLPKPKGLPVVVVIGRDGQVRQVEAGEMLPDDIADIAKHL